VAAKERTLDTSPRANSPSETGPPHGDMGSSAAWHSAACPACGGSGILRLAQRGHRTCLNCVGSGTVHQSEAPTISAVFADAR